MPWLFLLFTIVPLVELALLIKLGEVLGALPTLGLVIGTGLAGAALARWQGWRAMERVRAEMKSGTLPAQALVDGVLILVAGVLLITPGVLTDVVGLSLLIPPLRNLIKQGVRRWLAGKVQVHTAGWTAGGQQPQRPTVVDAEVIDARVVEDSRDGA